MKSRKPSQVFVSHAKADASRVKGILKGLVSTGVLHQADQVFNEKDLPSGHRSLRDEVRKQIQAASKVIVVWGPNSATSQWVNYEIGLADALGKPIIFVVPKDETVAPPRNLQNVQVIALTA
jgi:hypothetical protein